MAKLFSEKLHNLEKDVETLQLSRSSQLDDINKRLTECETKINQLITEITPILTSHANALKDLMSKLSTNRNDTFTK